MKQNIGIILCIFHGIRYFWKVYYRWNINGTYKMNQNMQNGTISELYTDDKNPKYSRNPNHILKSAKNFYQKFYKRDKSPTVPLLNLLVKFLAKRKSQINKFTSAREKLF